MQIAAFEAELDAPSLQSTACSVCWIVPDDPDDPVEMGEVVARLVEATGTVSWGVFGRWRDSEVLGPPVDQIRASSRLDAELRIGDTRLVADLVSLSPSDRWFWDEFTNGARRCQVAGALVPRESEIPRSLAYAGLQFVLSASAKQARPGVSYYHALDVLRQAFIAETLLATGMALTRVVPELLGAGLALTAARGALDQVVGGLSGVRPIDEVLLHRSLALGRVW
jgi:hypothetical protein